MRYAQWDRLKFGFERQLKTLQGNTNKRDTFSVVYKSGKVTFEGRIL